MGSVSANGRIITAFIDVKAHASGSFKTFLAETLTFDALGIVGAIKVTVTQNIYISLLAGDLCVGLGSISLRANAVVAGRGVLANCVIAAWLLQSGTLVNVHATSERIAGEIGFARANVTAGCVGAGGIFSTGVVCAFVDI